MVQSGTPTKPFPLKALALIAVIVGATAVAFTYTAGALSPQRLTPEKFIAALQSPSGPPLGHRRNHAKGICFTGDFEANGQGTELSTAQVFVRGQYPVIGRFNIAGTDPNAAYAVAPVRGFSVRIVTPDGQEWRSAMLDAPVFAAPTPDAFYRFLTASGSKDPAAMKAYIGAHPEILAFIDWVKGHPRTESWSEDRFNSLNSFIFSAADGARHAVRWSFIPAARATTLTPEELANRAPDFLAEDIVRRVAAGPQQWELMITVANPGDPTADPTKPWPEGRRSVDVGTLTVRQVEAEADGPCRDINYDPTVLPSGITTSDDPFPAARSAVYAVSYDSRTAESADYPRTTTGAKQ
jgi:catalase